MKFKVQNGANPKKGKQQDNTDVTFRTEIGRFVVTYYSQFVANSCFLLWVMQLKIIIGSENSCVIKPRRTSTRAQRVHGSGIVHVLSSF